MHIIYTKPAANLEVLHKILQNSQLQVKDHKFKFFLIIKKRSIYFNHVMILNVARSPLTTDQVR